MPIRNYGVLKGRVVRGIAEHHERTPHYEILVDAAGVQFRVAVDTRSNDHGRPDLLCACDEDFRHTLTDRLATVGDGFHPLGAGAGLDYVRGGFVERGQMRVIPADLPGPDNDLNEKVGRWVDRAAADASIALYVFGGRWGPEPERRDAIFGFLPGNGLHDVHMNQGSPPGRHARDNGAGQDGAILFHLQGEDRWIALFLAFQSQSWHTDERGDVTGLRPIEPFADDPPRHHHHHRHGRG
ncbi:MAG: YukJ family protein [Gemmatimonadetes bacterium]|nr:YukJ family protein [Gemmatimonadota bacterium]